jgi:hypothetical protein
MNLGGGVFRCGTDDDCNYFQYQQFGDEVFIPFWMRFLPIPKGMTAAEAAAQYVCADDGKIRIPVEETS